MGLRPTPHVNQPHADRASTDSLRDWTGAHARAREVVAQSPGRAAGETTAVVLAGGIVRMPLGFTPRLGAPPEAAA